MPPCAHQHRHADCTGRLHSQSVPGYLPIGAAWATMAVREVPSKCELAGQISMGQRARVQGHALLRALWVTLLGACTAQAPLPASGGREEYVDDRAPATIDAAP